MLYTTRGLAYLGPNEAPDLPGQTKAVADNLDAYRASVDSALAGAASGAPALHRALTFAQTAMIANGTKRVPLTPSAYDRQPGSNMTIPTTGANAGAVVIGTAGVYSIQCFYRADGNRNAHIRVNGLSVVEAQAPTSLAPALLETTTVLAVNDVVELAVTDGANSTSNWPPYATTDTRGATTPPMARFTITRLGA